MFILRALCMCFLGAWFAQCVSALEPREHQEINRPISYRSAHFDEAVVARKGAQSLSDVVLFPLNWMHKASVFVLNHSKRMSVFILWILSVWSPVSVLAENPDLVEKPHYLDCYHKKGHCESFAARDDCLFERFGDEVQVDVLCRHLKKDVPTCEQRVSGIKDQEKECYSEILYDKEAVDEAIEICRYQDCHNFHLTLLPEDFGISFLYCELCPTIDQERHFVYYPGRDP